MVCKGASFRSDRSLRKSRWFKPTSRGRCVRRDAIAEINVALPAARSRTSLCGEDHCEREHDGSAGEARGCAWSELIVRDLHVRACGCQYSDEDPEAEARIELLRDVREAAAVPASTCRA